jgi:hypothetical protein
MTCDDLEWPRMASDDRTHPIRTPTRHSSSLGVSCHFSSSSLSALLASGASATAAAAIAEVARTAQ